MPATTTKSDRKAQIDALLLDLPGVSARKIQINCAEAADYEKHLPLFKTSLEFVKTGRK